MLCQVMAKCSNRWSHLVSSSPSPQSSSFCKIVQKWRKSISYNCLVAVSFEYKNYGSGYCETLVELLYEGFSFVKTSKLVTFGHVLHYGDRFYFLKAYNYIHSVREKLVSSTSSVDKKRFVTICAIRGQKSKHPGGAQA